MAINIRQLYEVQSTEPSEGNMDLSSLSILSQLSYHCNAGTPTATLVVIAGGTLKSL